MIFRGNVRSKINIFIFRMKGINAYLCASGEESGINHDRVETPVGTNPPEQARGEGIKFNQYLPASFPHFVQISAQMSSPQRNPLYYGEACTFSLKLPCCCSWHSAISICRLQPHHHLSSVRARILPALFIDLFLAPRIWLFRKMFCVNYC